MPLTDENKDSFIAKTWSNDSLSRSGSGYGLRITKEDRDRYFRRSWTCVTLRLPVRGSTRSVEVNCAKKSFWNGCRELIHKEIGQWLIENGLDFWPNGNPHQFRLTRVTERVFDVTPL